MDPAEVEQLLDFEYDLPASDIPNAIHVSLQPMINDEASDFNKSNEPNKSNTTNSSGQSNAFDYNFNTISGVHQIDLLKGFSKIGGQTSSNSVNSSNQYSELDRLSEFYDPHVLDPLNVFNENTTFDDDNTLDGLDQPIVSGPNELSQLNQLILSTEETPQPHVWNFPYNNWDLKVSTASLHQRPLPDGLDSVHLDIEQLEFLIEGEPTFALPPYSNKHPDLLPSNAPINYPHLLDIQTSDDKFGYNCIHLHIADAIVTVLHNHDITALREFLDNKIKDFTFVYTVVAPEPPDDWLIQRHKNYVLVGRYKKLLEFNGRTSAIDWINQVIYIVRASGAWTPFRCSSFRHAPLGPDNTDVLWDAITHADFKAEHSLHAAQQVVCSARMLTNYLLKVRAVPDRHFVNRHWRRNCCEDGQDEKLALFL